MPLRLQMLTHHRENFISFLRLASVSKPYLSTTVWRSQNNQSTQHAHESYLLNKLRSFNAS